MRVLTWHVHAAWSTSLFGGGHDYVVPVVADRGPDGRGLAATYEWPAQVVERTPSQLADEQIDVVVLQRPHERELAAEWLGREPGRDVPAVYVEHNAPQGRITDMRHPLADQREIPIVHVTHFNSLFWDCGSARTCVIPHGVHDPGHRFSGEMERAVAVINEAARRGRVTGTDLLAALAPDGALDVFGIDSESVGGQGDLAHADLLDAMAMRRVYVHPIRWTSLGLSLIEAMMLGLPVVAVASTEVPQAVPSGAGVVSTRVSRLRRAVEGFIDDPGEAQRAGSVARDSALRCFGIEPFLESWDRLLTEVTA